MNKLKVWWIPNPPRPAFEREVSNVKEALVILETLADYDLYLGEGVIYCNVGGLQELVEDEWLEYESPQGYNLDDLMNDPDLLEEVLNNQYD